MEGIHLATRLKLFADHGHDLLVVHELQDVIPATVDRHVTENVLEHLTEVLMEFADALAEGLALSLTPTDVADVEEGTGGEEAVLTECLEEDPRVVLATPSGGMVVEVQDAVERGGVGLGPVLRMGEVLGLLNGVEQVGHGWISFEGERKTRHL